MPWRWHPGALSKPQLRIGVRKFNPESKGNEAAMADLLEKLQKDPDDVIAEAAKVAQDFTEAEMKRLN